MVLVLLFHAGLSFVPAGYVGVSVFFTLSGYLITTLLLAEHASAGRVARGRFWARRLRRLLPASLLCVAGIIVARQFGAFARVEHLRGDIVGANLQIYNWVKSTDRARYGRPVRRGARRRSSTTGRWPSRSSSTGSGRWPCGA